MGRSVEMIPYHGPRPTPWCTEYHTIVSTRSRFQDSAPVEYAGECACVLCHVIGGAAIWIE
jgi:hypothetical protein